MKKKILIGIAAAAFVAICFGIFLLSGAGSTYYYSQIDNTKIEQTESAGGVINFGGSMDYFYTLHCYDKDGNEKDITFGTSRETSVYKGYKRDKIEMRGDRAEMSDFPLYLNTVAGGLDRRDQTIGGFSFVVKIYAVPVVEIIG